MSATPDRAEAQTGAKPDSLRSTRAGAIWTALPARDRHLLLWLAGDSGRHRDCATGNAARLRAAAGGPASAGPPRRRSPLGRAERALQPSSNGRELQVLRTLSRRVPIELAAELGQPS